MSSPPPKRTAQRRVPLHTISEACAFVDGLDGAEIGELVVSAGTAVEGAIFIERGRVCWAAALGLARRLTELLVARSSIDASAMEEHYRRCSEWEVPLGEHLVGQGILSEADLRTALGEHTIDSLRCLCREGSSGAWYPRPGGGGYSPRFTFSTAELLARAHARDHEAAVSGLRDILASYFAEEDWAAAFVRTEASAVPAPICLSGRFPDSSATVLAFGRWAASALDVVSAFQDDDAVLSVDSTLDEPRQLVAFRHRRTIIAGATSAHGPARVLNRRARERSQRG